LKLASKFKVHQGDIVQKGQRTDSKYRDTQKMHYYARFWAKDIVKLDHGGGYHEKSFGAYMRESSSEQENE